MRSPSGPGVCTVLCRLVRQAGRVARRVQVPCRVVARNQHDEVVGVSLHIIWEVA